MTLRAHALADFLFYGLYRTDHLALGCPVDLWGVPRTRRWGHFPPYVARCDAASVDALPDLVEEYYRREELSRYDLPPAALRHRVAALAPRFSEYLSFWHEHVLPLESALLDSWRVQLREGEVLELLQRVTRLRWPFERLSLFACYHHPSGSALTPHPYLFSTVFDRYGVEPSVAWFLGHEGGHLLLDAVGWWDHPEAPAAIRWLGSRDLAEEALCLVLQNRLATICGLLPEAEMQVLPASTKHLVVYRWLQEHWDDYLTDAERFPTLIEFFLMGVREAKECNRRKRRRHDSYPATAPAA